MCTAPNPYAGGYISSDFLYPAPMQGPVPYIDSHSRPHSQMGVWPAGQGTIPYGSSRVMAASGAAFPATGIATVTTSGVAAFPASGVAAAPRSGGVVVPTSVDAAVPASGGASASTSGGDAVFRNSCGS